MEDSRIKTASEVLSAYFDEEQLKRGGRYAEFFASWKYLVGEQLAAHSHIADIKNAVLLVEAEHPGWIQLLQLRQSVILDGIAARFPEFGLRSIAFRLGPARPSTLSGNSKSPTAASTESTESDHAAQAKVEASTEEPTKAGRIGSLEEIKDPSLKAILSSLKDALRAEE